MHLRTAESRGQLIADGKFLLLTFLNGRVERCGPFSFATETKKAGLRQRLGLTLRGKKNPVRTQEPRPKDDREPIKLQKKKLNAEEEKFVKTLEKDNKQLVVRKRNIVTVPGHFVDSSSPMGNLQTVGATTQQIIPPSRGAAEHGGEFETRPTTRWCRSCGQELSMGARFCTECGQPTAVAEPSQPYTSPQSRQISKSCFRCGRTVLATAAYCDACGMPVNLVTALINTAVGKMKEPLAIIRNELGEALRQTNNSSRQIRCPRCGGQLYATPNPAYTFCYRCYQYFSAGF